MIEVFDALSFSFSRRDAPYITWWQRHTVGEWFVTRGAKYAKIIERAYNLWSTYVSHIMITWFTEIWSKSSTTFIPRDATQSAVMRLYVVCPFVR